MNMDQLFKALPRDLQWEILSEFVGSHSVRKGKLMRKLVFDYRHLRVQYLVCGIVKCNVPVYKEEYNTVTYAWLRDGSQLMFCEDPVSGEMGYTFRKRVPRTHSSMPKCWTREYFPMNNSIILPPFEKHVYPSYPDTDKKKKKRSSYKFY